MDLATVNVIGALARSVVQKRGKGGGALVGERPHTAITRTTFWAASSVRLASRGTWTYMILGGKPATRVAQISLVIRCHFLGTSEFASEKYSIVLCSLTV